MKILIAGGYSYPGANISKRFIEERHQVTIIDRIRRGAGRPLEATHKFYDLETSDEECWKVFESTRFDIAIYVSESIGQRYDRKAGSDTSGIINILNLGAKYGVKKFIVLTSAEIYGTGKGQPYDESSKVETVTPAGMGDNVREYYAFRIGNASKMPVLCLRISDIYGPFMVRGDGDDISGSKDGAHVCGSIIPDLINKAIYGKSITVRENGDNTRDFIYIDDMADAVYRAAFDKGCTGIFNISSGVETSLYKIIEIISGLKKLKSVKFEKNKKLSGASRFQVSNSRIEKTTGWKPQVSVEDGIRRTFEAESGMLEKSRKNKRKPLKKGTETAKPVRTAGRTALTVFENLILFLIFAFLQWGELFFDVKLPEMIMDYSVIYIIIAAAIWGQVQAYLAMFLSSVLFIGISIFTGTDIITFIYTPENLIRLAIYLLVGIITGYAIERRNREIEARELAFGALRNKYSFLLDIYNQTRLVKSELESQVIDTEDSFSSIYDTIQKVESLEIEAVYTGAVSAIEKIMKTGSVSIYVLSDAKSSHFARLKARSAELGDKIPNSININESGHYRVVIEEKSIYVNRDFQASVPILIAPIADEKKVIAVVSIHEAGFENLTSHYENLFATIITLITNAIKRAYYFEESLKHKRYVPGTKVLNSETFGKILAQVSKNSQELDMSYSLLTVMQGEKTLKEISDLVFQAIRENDYLGLGEDDSIYILLSNTKNNYAHIVIERLSARGIKSSLIKEEYIDF